MANFDKAVAFSLDKEGVFSNVAADSGKKTKYGITEGELRGYQLTTGKLAGRQIQDLTREEAKSIFLADYWRYDDVNVQMIATKLFDIGVNMGVGTAALIAQRAINFIADAKHVDEDGQWGPQTLMAINLICAVRGEALRLYKAMTLFQAKRYVEIVLAKRSQLEFIDGWVARAGSRPPS